MTKSVVWLGDVPKLCEFCNQNPLDKQFVDGPVVAGGPWGCICIPCHKRSGVGLGTGRGQRYAKQPDGKWLKVEG